MKVAACVAVFAAVVGCKGFSTQLGGSLPGIGGGGSGGSEKVQDEVSSGLQTANMLDAQPAGFRVTWINWDSAFRTTDLRIGDHVIAVDGVAYVKPAKLEDLQRMLPKVIGGYAEHQFWAERRARDGTEITLTVQRRAKSGVGVETLTIRGKLRAERIYSAGTRRLLGPGGPDGLASDGFDGAWSGWYEKRRAEWEKVLDRGWTQQQVNSRMALADHLEDKKRVDFLAATYPGPFAKAVVADWERVRASLVGRRYEIGERDLQYRRLGEQRAIEVSAAAKAAREQVLANVKADSIAPFPAIDPIRGDRAKVAGKVVALPEVSQRDWISEAGHGYLVIAERGGAYFVDMEKPEARRMLEARYRYTKYVAPTLKETYQVIGRIEPEPKMLVRGGRAITGLEVKPIAVTVGGAMFVDLTKGGGGEAKFAGEDTLAVPKLALPPPTASPREVMETFITALEYGEETTWKSLYATWWAEDWKEEGVLYRPFYARSLDEDWIRSRRLMLDRVYKVAVIYVGAPRHILTGREFPKAPVIEQVLVEVDHVGKFDGAYHAFTDVNVHRVWLLQRRDGGPWRIASHQGL